jgi:hypothetical protein
MLSSGKPLMKPVEGVSRSSLIFEITQTAGGDWWKGEGVGDLGRRRHHGSVVVTDEST